MIKRDNFFPIIDFLNGDLQIKCKNLIKLYYKNEEDAYLFVSMKAIIDASNNFPIREAMINDCIKYYGKLGVGTQTLICADLYAACKILVPKYRDRNENNKTKNIIDLGCEGVMNTELFISKQCDAICAPNYENDGRTFNATGYGSYYARLINEFRDKLRIDLVESMEVYQAIHGLPHPLWNEFCKM